MVLLVAMLLAVQPEHAHGGWLQNLVTLIPAAIRTRVTLWTTNTTTFFKRHPLPFVFGTLAITCFFVNMKWPVVKQKDKKNDKPDENDKNENNNNENNNENQDDQNNQLQENNQQNNLNDNNSMPIENQQNNQFTNQPQTNQFDQKQNIEQNKNNLIQNQPNPNEQPKIELNANSKQNERQEEPLEKPNELVNNNYQIPSQQLKNDKKNGSENQNNLNNENQDFSNNQLQENKNVNQIEQSKNEPDTNNQEQKIVEKENNKNDSVKNNDNQILTQPIVEIEEKKNDREIEEKNEEQWLKENSSSHEKFYETIVTIFSTLESRATSQEQLKQYERNKKDQEILNKAQNNVNEATKFVEKQLERGKNLINRLTAEQKKTYLTKGLMGASPDGDQDKESLLYSLISKLAGTTSSPSYEGKKWASEDYFKYNKLKHVSCSKEKIDFLTWIFDTQRDSTPLDIVEKVNEDARWSRKMLQIQTFSLALSTNNPSLIECLKNKIEFVDEANVITLQLNPLKNFVLCYEDSNVDLCRNDSAETIVKKHGLYPCIKPLVDAFEKEKLEKIIIHDCSKSDPKEHVYYTLIEYFIKLANDCSNDLKELKVQSLYEIIIAIYDKVKSFGDYLPETAREGLKSLREYLLETNKKLYENSSIIKDIDAKLDDLKHEKESFVTAIDKAIRSSNLNSIRCLCSKIEAKKLSVFLTSNTDKESLSPLEQAIASANQKIGNPKNEISAIYCDTTKDRLSIIKYLLEQISPKKNDEDVKKFLLQALLTQDCEILHLLLEKFKPKVETLQLVIKEFLTSAEIITYTTLNCHKKLEERKDIQEAAVNEAKKIEVIRSIGVYPCLHKLFTYIKGKKGTLVVQYKNKKNKNKKKEKPIAVEMLCTLGMANSPDSLYQQALCEAIYYLYEKADEATKGMILNKNNQDEDYVTGKKRFEKYNEKREALLNRCLAQVENGRIGMVKEAFSPAIISPECKELLKALLSPNSAKKRANASTKKNKLEDAITKQDSALVSMLIAASEDRIPKIEDFSDVVSAALNKPTTWISVTSLEEFNGLKEQLKNEEWCMENAGLFPCFKKYFDAFANKDLNPAWIEQLLIGIGADNQGLENIRVKELLKTVVYLYSKIQELGISKLKDNEEGNEFIVNGLGYLQDYAKELGNKCPKGLLDAIKKVLPVSNKRENEKQKKHVKEEKEEKKEKSEKKNKNEKNDEKKQKNTEEKKVPNKKIENKPEKKIKKEEKKQIEEKIKKKKENPQKTNKNKARDKNEIEEKPEKKGVDKQLADAVEKSRGLCSNTTTTDKINYTQIAPSLAQESLKLFDEILKNGHTVKAWYDNEQDKKIALNIINFGLKTQSTDIVKALLKDNTLVKSDLIELNQIMFESNIYVYADNAPTKLTADQHGIYPCLKLVFDTLKGEGYILKDLRVPFYGVQCPLVAWLLYWMGERESVGGFSQHEQVDKFMKDSICKVILDIFEQNPEAGLGKLKLLGEEQAKESAEHDLDYKKSVIKGLKTLFEYAKKIGHKAAIKATAEKLIDKKEAEKFYENACKYLKKENLKGLKEEYDKLDEYYKSCPDRIFADKNNHSLLLKAMYKLSGTLGSKFETDEKVTVGDLVDITRATVAKDFIDFLINTAGVNIITQENAKKKLHALAIAISSQQYKPIVDLIIAKEPLSKNNIPLVLKQFKSFKFMSGVNVFDIASETFNEEQLINKIGYYPCLKPIIDFCAQNNTVVNEKENLTIVGYLFNFMSTKNLIAVKNFNAKAFCELLLRYHTQKKNLAPMFDMEIFNSKTKNLGWFEQRLELLEEYIKNNKFAVDDKGNLLNININESVDDKGNQSNNKEKLKEIKINELKNSIKNTREQLKKLAQLEKNKPNVDKKTRTALETAIKENNFENFKKTCAEYCKKYSDGDFKNLLTTIEKDTDKALFHQALEKACVGNNLLIDPKHESGNYSYIDIDNGKLEKFLAIVKYLVDDCKLPLHGIEYKEKTINALDIAIKYQYIPLIEYLCTKLTTKEKSELNFDDDIIFCGTLEDGDGSVTRAYLKKEDSRDKSHHTMGLYPSFSKIINTLNKQELSKLRLCDNSFDFVTWCLYTLGRLDGDAENFRTQAVCKTIIKTYNKTETCDVTPAKKYHEDIRKGLTCFDKYLKKNKVKIAGISNQNAPINQLKLAVADNQPAAEKKKKEKE